MKTILSALCLVTLLTACGEESKKDTPAPKPDTGPNATRFFNAVYKGQPVTWGSRARVEQLSQGLQRITIAGGASTGTDSVLLVVEKPNVSPWEAPGSYSYAFITVKTTTGSVNSPSGRITVNYSASTGLLTGDFTSPGQASSGTFSVPRP